MLTELCVLVTIQTDNHSDGDGNHSNVDVGRCDSIKETATMTNNEPMHNGFDT